MVKKERPFLKNLLLYAKGLCVGAADSVPGISGGTIAFISGIYEELIYSLRSFVPKNFKLLFSGRIKEFWTAINGKFLSILLLGIATGIILIAKIVLRSLDLFPVATWSFFSGLILISTISVLRAIEKFNIRVFIAFGVGAVIAYLLTILSAAQTPNELWFIFICGAVAICAMILPGISGAFILLLMGKYQYILSALYEFKVLTLAVFAGGAVIGLLSFSHFLSWLLRKLHDITIGLLAGFMFGALNKVWPWKVQINTFTGEKLPWNMERFTDHSVKWIESSQLPDTFEKMTGADAELNVGIISALAAIIIFCTIEAIGGAKKQTQF